MSTQRIEELERQLAEVTAERDRLDKLYVGEMKEVARLEDELADVGLYLDKLLRAVEAWRDSYSRPLREPYNEALAENAAIALVTLAAKIRKERS